MGYEKEYTALFGERAVNLLLEAVDNGQIDVDQGETIGCKLHPSVGGEFKHNRNERNFKWNRRAMRKIISSFYNLCSPTTETEKQDARGKLLSILSDPDIALDNFSKDVARC